MRRELKTKGAGGGGAGREMVDSHTSLFLLGGNKVTAERKKNSCYELRTSNKLI